ncbi:MAG: aldose 1-epimerase [Bryobacteraceae bacterium]
MRLLVVLLFPIMSLAADYSAEKAVVDGIEVVRLSYPAQGVEVSIVPSLGNMAYEFKINGQNVFWMPYATLGELRAKPQFGGIPFLAPWANRLSEDAFFANGKKYKLNPDLGNVRRDQNGKPIHGLLNFSPDWEVTAMETDDHSARVTSRLEFWKHPELMAQFPFAHVIEMTYILSRDTLEVRTAIHNLSTDPMPVGIGYHPYFQIHDAPRDQWKVHLAARDHFVLSKMLIPTGERTPLEFPRLFPLAGVSLDDVFSVWDDTASSNASLPTFSVQGVHQQISVRYGPKFPIAVVYAPPGRSFICFEPMSIITDGFNLAHAGVYQGLQSIPPGGEWHESFWIVPSGF